MVIYYVNLKTRSKGEKQQQDKFKMWKHFNVQ